MRMLQIISATALFAFLPIQGLCAAEKPKEEIPSQVKPEEGKIDFAKIERTIAKEPKYVSEKPAYYLFFFDKDCKTPVWAVFDIANAGDKSYDVLHIDLNGNGDLTEEGEKIVSAAKNPKSPLRNFVIAEFKVPNTELKHKNLSFQHWGDPFDKGVQTHAAWNGKDFIWAGWNPYGSVGNTKPGNKIENAPILHMTREGNLRFHIFETEKTKNWKIGAKVPYSFFIVKDGSDGDHTLTAQNISTLDLKKDKFKFSLTYKDKDGKEKTVEADVDHSC